MKKTYILQIESRNMPISSLPSKTSFWELQDTELLFSFFFFRCYIIDIIKTMKWKRGVQEVFFYSIGLIIKLLYITHFLKNSIL